MPLRYRIKFLVKRLETVIFITLFILLLVVCLWSLKTPNRNTVLVEEVMQNEIDTTDFRKDQEAENSIESDINFTDINKNLDQGNSSEGEKAEQRTIERNRSNDILIKQFPALKTLDKLEFQATLGADTISVNNKRLPRSTSYSTVYPDFKEKTFGYLAITLKNAHEYGYGYVFIDGTIWQQGEYNTTPLKVRLPIGNHKVEVKRDNFFSSPVDTSIFIEKGVEKRVSFVLIPKIKVGSVKSSIKNNISNR